MIKTLRFDGDRLLEKIRDETQHVQSEHDNKSTYEILVDGVSFIKRLAAALGKLIASLACRTDDWHGTSCRIAKLHLRSCHGFSAAIVAALFQLKSKGDTMMECFHVSVYPLSELILLLTYVPKRMRIANAWKIWAPPKPRLIEPEDAQAFAHHLAQVQGISQLDLFGFGATQVSNAGPELPSHLVLLLANRIASWPLKALHVVHCGLDDAAAAKLIGLLSRQPMQNNITSFSLASCYLEEETFASLGEWLAHLRCRLESLDLSRWYLRDSRSDSGSYYRPFFEILARQDTLKHLDMTGNFLDDSFSANLARVFRQNTTLESCKFDLQWFGRNGMETLTNALKHSGETLQSVQLLEYDKMLQKGWTGMCVDALKANPRLVSVTWSDVEDYDDDDSIFSFPDPPCLIQEYHYFLSLNKAGRAYFCLVDGDATTSPPLTTSPLPLALWPHLLARAALVTSEGASEAELIYRMLRDGPLVQQLHNLRANHLNNMSRKRRCC